MISGLERYFQLVRCFRDEDFRADRQPEFTQIDIEMSFVTREDVVEVAEDLVEKLWLEIAGYQVPRPIPHMTYADAMAKYGSDKPDLRFGQQLADMTDFFSESEFRVFQAPHVGAVVMPGGGAQTRKELDGWQEWAKSRGARGLAYVLIGPDGEVADAGPVAKHLSAEERAGLSPAARRRRGRRRVLRRGHGERGAGAARRGPAGDRAPVRPDRPGRVGVHLGGGRAHVRGGRRRRLDRGASPVHLAAAGVDGQVHGRSWRCPGRRLRHRVQRHRDRRRVDQDSPAGRAAARLRRDRAVQGRGDVAVRLPAGGAAVRAAAARRHRVRLGPADDAADRPGLDPGRDRVPEGRLRARPAHRRADADHRAAAQGSWHRRRPAQRGQRHLDAGASGASSRRTPLGAVRRAGGGSTRRRPRPGRTARATKIAVSYPWKTQNRLAG